MTKRVHARGLIVLLSAICLTTIAAAQTSWSRTYGGHGPDYGYSVQQTSDGGYIVAGCTRSFGAGIPDSGNVYLINTNASGDTIWTRTYGGTGSDGGYSVQQTPDGGYIIAGYTCSFGSGGADVYLIKTNASGDTLWTRTYGGSGDDEGCSIQRTADSGYIIAGRTYSFGAGTPNCDNVYLIKTNAHGDTLWTRTYGGTNNDWGNSVQQTTDGGYIITGGTVSDAGYSDVCLIKTNAHGDTLWTRTYGGAVLGAGCSVQETAGSGYVITGYTWSYGAGGAAYLVKADADGDTLWTRTYGGTGDDEGHSVQQTTDGGYVITGWTESFGAGYADVYLIKTNARGDTLWTRTYGGPGIDEGQQAQQTSDGGYIIAGWIYSFDLGTPDTNVCLIKTDSLGNVGVEEPQPRQPLRPTRFLVQPNPFTSVARVPGHETDVFTLSDVTGRQVAICKGDRIGLGLRPGVYFLSPVGSGSGKAATTTTVVKTAF